MVTRNPKSQLNYPLRGVDPGFGVTICNCNPTPATEVQAKRGLLFLLFSWA